MDPIGSNTKISMLPPRDFKTMNYLAQGKVYKGTLPDSKEIAVKKVSHDSKQGMQEFVAEIVSLGQLSHRNLVQLLGYCRRQGELLLVYEYIEKGSLFEILHQNDNSDLTLNWDKRFDILKSIASGLLYLHEGWEKIVIHRDIKASNVLLDLEDNAKLSDFGLAMLHDRGANPRATTVQGTLGYLAPEYSTSGIATPRIDVFSFGVLTLEIVCGRRPIQTPTSTEDSSLVHMVFRHWKSGDILTLVDPKMEGNYSKEKVMMVLKLGLLCLNVVPEERPTMREVVGYLNEMVVVPDLGELELGSTGLSFVKMFNYSTSITKSQFLKVR